MLYGYTDIYCEKKFYVCNNQCFFYKSKVETLTDNILKRCFAWVPMKDYDDFYSIAGLIVWQCEKTYDKESSVCFEKYLVSCIEKKIKSHITYINRKKRKNRDEKGNLSNDLSLDELIDKEKRNVANFSAHINDVEIMDLSNCFKYMATLPEDARMSIRLKMMGYEWAEIQKKLKFTSQYMKDIRQLLKKPERIKILRREKSELKN